MDNCSNKTDHCVQLPATESTRSALHEATGHLYDALAEARLEDEPIPGDVFDAIEEFYVATAEEVGEEIRIYCEIE